MSATSYRWGDYSTDDPPGGVLSEEEWNRRRNSGIADKHCGLTSSEGTTAYRLWCKGYEDYQKEHKVQATEDLKSHRRMRREKWMWRGIGVVVVLIILGAVAGIGYAIYVSTKGGSGTSSGSGGSHSGGPNSGQTWSNQVNTRAHFS